MNEPEQSPRGWKWWTFIVVSGTAVVALLLTALATWGLGWVMSGDTKWFENDSITGEGGLFEIVRASVALVGVVGIAIGGALAYRRQRLGESQFKLAQSQDEEQRAKDRRDHDRDVVAALRDRFTTAAAQLGDDNLSVRLAGVYAMAALADEWLARRDADKRADEEAQVCIEVLCAYVRADASPVQGQLPQDDDADYPQWDVEVRQAVVSTIAKRLRREYPAWAGRTFDFTGSRFSGQFDLNETHLGSPDTTVIFYRACFSAGRVDLRHTVFSGGLVDFGEAKFSGAYVYFDEAELSGGIVDFSGASFTRGYLDFERATFCGGVLDFDDAEFSGGAVDFRWAAFQGRRMFAIHEDVKFGSARFAGARVDFRRAKFAGGNVDFRGAHFSDGVVDFRQAEFSGGAVYFVEVRSSDGQLRPVRGSYFVEAMFSGGKVDFREAEFSGGEVGFNGAEFSGAKVLFGNAVFSGGRVMFDEVAAQDESWPTDGPWPIGEPPEVWPPWERGIDEERYTHGPPDP